MSVWVDWQNVIVKIIKIIKIDWMINPIFLNVNATPFYQMVYQFVISILLPEKQNSSISKRKFIFINRPKNYHQIIYTIIIIISTQ